MGVALWAVSGLIAFCVARNVPSARPLGRWGELVAAIISALLLGMAATVLDFGGWRELDWRAAAFCFCGALAVIAAVRLVRMKS